MLSSEEGHQGAGVSPEKGKGLEKRRLRKTFWLSTLPDRRVQPEGSGSAPGNKGPGQGERASSCTKGGLS